MDDALALQDDALALLKDRIRENPEVFLVLGSGLGSLVDTISEEASLGFQEIPGFPRTGVEGHSGRLVYGRMEGKRVLAQVGRFHFYENPGPGVVAAPVRLAAALGVPVVVLTNAAGGVAPELELGSVLLLDDHLNLMGRNPLAGPVLEGEERFPDMSRPFDPSLQELALQVAREQEVPLSRGCYAGVLGPSYETPAEIRYLRSVGADAVGMSTVPEVITARALGMRALAFSLITNYGAGLGAGPLSHEEVLEVGRWAGGRLGELVRGVVARLES